MLLFLLISILIFATFIYYAEFDEAESRMSSSVFARLWWALVTLSTVGYGDLVPYSTFGKVNDFFKE